MGSSNRTSRTSSVTMTKLMLAVLLVCALDITRVLSDPEKAKMSSSLIRSAQKLRGGDAAVRSSQAVTLGCNCQCSDLVVISNGVLHGNCNSGHGDKKLEWCYTHDRYNDCKDIKVDRDVGNRLWSVQACATPSRNDADCFFAPEPESNGPFSKSVSPLSPWR